eukprot:tig00000241_g20932.t1
MYLRRLLPRGAPVGLFVHTPWPDPEAPPGPGARGRAGPPRLTAAPQLFHAFPARAACHADQVAFQDAEYCRHFAAAASIALGPPRAPAPSGAPRRASPGGAQGSPRGRTASRWTRRTPRRPVSAEPMGIRPDHIQRALASPAARRPAPRPPAARRLLARAAGRGRQVRERVAAVRGQEAGRALVVGVDRLDPQAGLLLKLSAFERLLRERPDLRERARPPRPARPAPRAPAAHLTPGQVTLLQVLRPSLLGGPGHSEMKAEARWYGTLVWRPVHHAAAPAEFGELVALLAAADVCLATPVRDGLGLLALEFAAAHAGGGAGVLVLSEFAGAAKLLSEALRVNPWDVPMVCAALERALAMPDHERRARADASARYVAAHTAGAWRRALLGQLRAASDANRAARAAAERPLPPVAIDELAAAYRDPGARGRLLVIDADRGLGLAEEEAGPLRAPGRGVAASLAALCAGARGPASAVVAVSRRPRAEVEAAFESVPGIGLAAETGAEFSWPPPDGGEREWRRLCEPPGADLHESVLGHVQAASGAVPGSHIRRGRYSVSWHFGGAPDAGLAFWQAGRVQAALVESLAVGPCELLRTERSLELRPRALRHGALVRHLLGELCGLRCGGPPVDVVVCLGAGEGDLFACLAGAAASQAAGHGHPRAPAAAVVGRERSADSAEGAASLTSPDAGGSRGPAPPAALEAAVAALALNPAPRRGRRRRRGAPPPSEVDPEELVSYPELERAVLGVGLKQAGRHGATARLERADVPALLAALAGRPFPEE